MAGRSDMPPPPSQGMKASEIFPDLHHKMSKKIAQLTKVIYHLNTKNEDHQYEIDALQKNHQAELQRILEDAASKINRFKEQLAEKQSKVNSDVIIEKLKKKHEQEKQEALNQFQGFKQASQARESKIQQDMHGKMEALRVEVETHKRKLLDAMQLFASSSKEMREDFAKNRGVGEEAVMGIKVAHRKEVEDLVKAGNERFQAMVLDYTVKMEELREQLDKEKQAALSDAAKKHEDQLGKLRAELQGDKQTTLQKQKLDFEQKLKEQREDFMSKQARMLDELQDSKQHEKELQAALDSSKAVEQSLNGQLRDLQKELERFRADAQAQAASLGDGQSRLQEALRQREESLKAAETQIRELESTINQRDTALAKLEQEKDKLLKKVEMVQKEYEMYKAAMTEEMVSKEGELAEKEGSIALLKQRLAEQGSGSGKQIAQLEEKLRNEQSERAADVQRLEAEIDLLKAQLAALREGSSSESSQLQNQLQNLQHTLQDTESSWSQRMDKTCADHAAAIEEEQRNAERRCEELKAEFERRQNELGSSASQKEQTLLSEIQELKGQHEKQLMDMREKQVQAALEMSSLLEGKAKESDSAIARLESALRDARIGAEKREKELRRQLQDSIQKCDSLEKQLEDTRHAAEDQGSLAQKLRNTIEELQAENSRTIQTWEKKLSEEIQKLNDEWSQKLSRLDADALCTNKLLQQQWEERLVKELQDLRTKLTDSHAEESEKLNLELARLNKSLLIFSEQSSSERADLMAEMDALKTTHQKELSDMNGQHQVNLQQALQRAGQEQESLRAQLQKEHQEGLENAKAVFDKLTESLKSGHHSELESLKLKNAQELEQAKNKWENQQRKALEEAERARQKSLEQQQQTFQKELAAKLGNEQSKWNAEKAVLNEQIEAIHKKMNDQMKDFGQLQKTLEYAQQEHEGTKAKMKKQESDLINEQHQMKSQLLDKHRSEMAALQKELSSKLEGTTKTFNTQLDELQGEKSNLLMQIQVWEERYTNRESREEDVSRISELEQQVVEMTMQIRKLSEEMIFYKRELLNREENYNKKFNNAPNIGVMQVIKPKAAGGPVNGKVPSGRSQPTNPLMKGPSSQSFQPNLGTGSSKSSGGSQSQNLHLNQRSR